MWRDSRLAPFSLSVDAAAGGGERDCVESRGFVVGGSGVLESAAGGACVASARSLSSTQAGSGTTDFGASLSSFGCAATLLGGVAATAAGASTVSELLRSVSAVGARGLTLLASASLFTSGPPPTLGLLTLADLLRLPRAVPC